VVVGVSKEVTTGSAYKMNSKQGCFRFMGFVVMEGLRLLFRMWGMPTWNLRSQIDFAEVCRHLPKSSYYRTPRSRVLLENLTGPQLSKKYPAFYGTRRFITAFTSVRHLSLTWASSIQSILPHHTFSRSIVILSSHLSLGLPGGLFHSGFPTKTVYTPLLYPHTRYMPRPSHSYRLITHQYWVSSTDH